MKCICSICHKTLQKESATALRCGHIFDRNCIATWVSHNPVCPICRASASLQSFITVFWTEEDEDEPVLCDDFTELIDQLDKIKIQRGRLSTKQLKHLEDLHEAYGGEDASIVIQLKRLEKEKEEISAQYQELLEMLCELQCNEVASLNRFDGFRRLKKLSCEIRYANYEALREVHDKEYIGLKDKLEKVMNDKNEKISQHRTRLETLLNSEKKYRELMGNHMMMLKCDQSHRDQLQLYRLHSFSCPKYHSKITYYTFKS